MFPLNVQYLRSAIAFLVVGATGIMAVFGIEVLFIMKYMKCLLETEVSVLVP